ncbi:UNKNOWN [Stylonychia lemnae]|uniref:HMG box domain-containing protein n=1 Tax=Stylonychia lemnae TaxID=5949 RepID=A0A077ZS35_STYLE|nr:UNKNOWN [Stylonychia lemnae]|eukprot:CDW72713.1 UNKNOWN [Stylonychia lemnae]
MSSDNSKRTSSSIQNPEEEQEKKREKKAKNKRGGCSTVDKPKIKQTIVLNQKKQNCTRTPKKPKEQNKKPPTAYQLFCKFRREQLKKDNSQMGLMESSKLIGDEWSKMNESQKKRWIENAKEKRLEFDMQSYQLSKKGKTEKGEIRSSVNNDKGVLSDSSSSQSTKDVNLNKQRPNTTTDQFKQVKLKIKEQRKDSSDSLSEISSSQKSQQSHRCKKSLKNIIKRRFSEEST